MQNEFEKRVQQKLEELNLVPSEPVWVNIEKEIRRKSKRRFFILLPFLLLLIGGGLFWTFGINRGSDLNSNNTISNTTSTNSSKTSELKAPETNNEIQKENKDYTSLSDKSNIIKKTNEFKEPNSIQRSKKISLLKKDALVKNISSVTPILKSSASNEVGIINNDLTLNDATENTRNEEKLLRDRTTLDHLLFSPVFNPSFDAQEHTIVENSEKKVVITPRYKWKTGVEISAGTSNQTQSQGSSNKSYASYTPGSIPSSNVIIQSPYTRDISFSTGITLTKKLNKQLEFQTGLSYQYLSFNILVGQYVRQDTLLSFNSVNQFYRNTAFSSGSTTIMSNYKNQLHFLSIPIKLHFQPFRRIPVRLTAGLIAQQLIHSNMLIYDENSGAYFSSKKLLNKFLFSSSVGVEYSFIFLKHTFSVGPVFNYGLSNTIKYKAGQLYDFNFRVSMGIKK